MQHELFALLVRGGLFALFVICHLKISLKWEVSDFVLL